MPLTCSLIRPEPHRGWPNRGSWNSASFQLSANSSPSQFPRDFSQIQKAGLCLCCETVRARHFDSQQSHLRRANRFTFLIRSPYRAYICFREELCAHFQICLLRFRVIRLPNFAFRWFNKVTIIIMHAFNAGVCVDPRSERDN